MNPAEILTTRLLYQRQQYVVMPGYITDQFVADYRKWLEDSILSLSILGDESDHSWSEIPEPTLSSMKDIVDTEVLEAILERPIQSWAQWINVYSSAQFIAGDLRPYFPPVFWRILGFFVASCGLFFQSYFHGVLTGRDVSQRGMWSMLVVILLP